MAFHWLNRRFHDHQEKSARVIQARKKIVELIGADDILEIGCGLGANSNYCQGDYIGVDIDPVAIEHAQKRHPDKSFICLGISGVKPYLQESRIVLFCAILHEIPEFCQAIQPILTSPVSRIFICDYDPALTGWLKVWMKIFEPQANHWWNNQPDTCFPSSEWSIQTGQITPALCFWDVKRILF